MKSFSQVDKMVREFDLNSVGALSKAVVKDEDEEGELLAVEPFEDEKKVVVSEKFLRVYAVARPILQLIASFPILPGKWRAVIRVLLQGIDDLVAMP